MGKSSAAMSEPSLCQSWSRWERKSTVSEFGCLRTTYSSSTIGCNFDPENSSKGTVNLKKVSCIFVKFIFRSVVDGCSTYQRISESREEMNRKKSRWGSDSVGSESTLFILRSLPPSPLSQKCRTYHLQPGPRHNDLLVSLVRLA